MHSGSSHQVLFAAADLPRAAAADHHRPSQVGRTDGIVEGLHPDPHGRPPQVTSVRQPATQPRRVSSCVTRQSSPRAPRPVGPAPVHRRRPRSGGGRAPGVTFKRDLKFVL